MTRKSVDIDLRANSGAAVAELRKLERAAKDTDDGIEDIESSGKLMARALERATDDAIAELEATRRAVDALDRALDDVDMDSDALVADLKRAGLSAQDIEADVEDLAAALRRTGDVKIRAQDLGFDDLDQALGRTSEHGRVTSTAIGGIGNSISELPGVGSLGPVAESMGMLAENALEGEANLKGLVVAGAGLAAVGLAVKVVQGHFSDLAEIEAWRTEQIDDWTEAIYEAEDAVDGLVESYRNAGQIEVRTLIGGIKDITSELARAGITVDDWTDAVQGGNAETERLADRLRTAGLSGEQAQNVLQGLIFAQEDYAEATREAAERTAVFGTAAGAASKEVQHLADQLSNVAGDHEARITIDTLAANQALGELIANLDRAGVKASQLSILSANRFNTGATVVQVPAGYTPADVKDLERRYSARNVE